MAIALTVSKRVSLGSIRKVYGTFTSAVGDSSMSILKATHGCNQVLEADINFNSSVLDGHKPKIVITTGGVVTVTFADTRGYSGNWSVEGRT